MKHVYLILSLTLSLTAAAQTEFFVHVDPSTGVHSIKDSIPGVKTIQIGPAYSAVDSKNNVYYFKGGNSSGQWFFGLNGNTGQIITKAPMPTQQGPYVNIGGVEHDDSTGILYCIAWNPTTSKEHFLQINKFTGILSSVSVLPDVYGIAIGESTYDQLNHHYIFKGIDTANNDRLYRINSLTGLVVSAPFISNNLGAYKIKFNSVTSKLYCFTNASPGKNLIELNPATGFSVSTVATFSAMQSIAIFPNFHSINTISNQLTFKHNSNLVTVNLSSGTVVHNTPFPVGLTNQQNVIELRYNENNGNLLALHWGQLPITVSLNESDLNSSHVNICPNPVLDKASVRLADQAEITGVSFYDVEGRLLRKEKMSGDHYYIFERKELPSGIYYLQIGDKEGRQYIEKIVLQ